MANPYFLASFLHLVSSSLESKEGIVKRQAATPTDEFSPALAHAQKQRKTANWTHGVPMKASTFAALLEELEVAQLPARRAVCVLTGAVEKVVDNEADAKETIKRLRARNKSKSTK